MTPQTLRGYTKIEFTKYKDVDDNKPVKSYMQQETNAIQEEPSPPATSKSSSSKHDLNTPKSNFTLDTPKTLLEKAAVEEYNAGIESLYVSILEWMLSRSPSNLNEPLMIDDSDEINNPNVLIILFNLIKYSNDLLKQKALQDFQMLAKLNKMNCYHFLESKFFHPWILNLLLPYQISLSCNTLVGPSFAVYDIGKKLHSIVLTHSMVNETKNRFALYMARWPLILSYQENKNKSNAIQKIEWANQLINSLFSSLIKWVMLEASKWRPWIDQPIWANVAGLAFIIDEIAFNGRPTNIEFKSGYKSIYEDYAPVLNKAIVNSNDIKQDSNSSLQTNDSWIINEIFKVLNFLWPASLFDSIESLGPRESKILSLLSRTSDDDFAKDVEILMYDGIKDKKSTTKESHEYFLRWVVNLICLKISLLTDKQSLEYWLDIILRMVKYLLLTSETWISKDINYYKNAQKKIADSIAFIIWFLYKETIINPKKEIVKLISSWLEEIMINFLVTFEYSGIKYTPQQLKQTNHKTASRELFYSILSIDGDSLITLKHIELLKSSEYKNIQKVLLQSENWRVLMQNSPILEEIIENHISGDILDTIDKKRKIYAMNTLEIEMAADRSKDDKTSKLHSEIIEVVTTISEKSFEIKNKSLINNEHLKRGYRHEWRKISKEMTLWKGVWRNKQFFDSNILLIPTTMSKTIIKGISKPILESRTETDYMYFNDEISKTYIDESRVSFIKNDAFAYQYQDPSIPNVQTNRNGDKNQIEIKIFSKDLTDREIDTLSQTYIGNILGVNIKSKAVKEYSWSMITPLYFRNGKVVVTSSDLYFFDDLKSLSLSDEYCESNIWKKNIEFIKYKKPNHSMIFKKWDLTEISMVFYRMFLSKSSSAEIYFNSEKSVLFYLNSSEDRDSFWKQIYKQRDKKEATPKSFIIQSGKKAFKEKKILDKWMNWEISTYEYLMNVNIFANRSFHDISHYPVFPWLHLNKNQNGGTEWLSIQDWARDLTKNMGQLGSKERLEEFMRKYEEGDSFQNDSYHYGSHYSHPGIVLHYLIRVHPFTEGCLSLQGGHYDAADRLFSSVPNAIENALNDIADVREIIPEFFFLPEMFIKRNGIILGTTQSGRVIENVDLPKWAKNNPHRYVWELKKFLEGDYVSSTINQWIDYMYGYKQKGKEAVKSINVYPHYTYEQTAKDEKDEEDSVKGIGTEVSLYQGYNFGQTPSLLFKEAHKKRLQKGKALKFNLIVDLEASVRPYRPVDNQRSVIIFYSKFIDNKKILTLTREKTIKSFNLKSKTNQNNPNSPFTIEASYEKELPQSYCTYLDNYNLKDNTFQILDEVELLLGKGTHIVRGGLWNGTVVIWNVETGKIEIIQAHTSTVTCIAVDEKEKFVISGSKNGDVIFWEINQDKQDWKKKYHFYHHEDFITSINIKDSLALTSSLDASVNLYNMNGKLLRTFYHPNGNPILTAVYSNAPLPWVVLFSFRDKIFYSYSINGELISSWSEKEGDPLRWVTDQNLQYDLIRSPKVISDSNFNDHLIYGTDKGTILIRSLPYLDNPRYLIVSSGFSILTLLVSNDRRFLLVGATIGGLRVLTDPKFLSNSSEEISTNTTNNQN